MTVQGKWGMKDPGTVLRLSDSGWVNQGGGQIQPQLLLYKYQCHKSSTKMASLCD